ncbi:cytochrome c oxidase subunit 1 [Borealophlyctis nickersoniae]|nr:cytochrome c oxidase subunit 1 [Borealophlyctis nickersoniae]
MNERAKTAEPTLSVMLVGQKVEARQNEGMTGSRSASGRLYRARSHSRGSSVDTDGYPTEGRHTRFPDAIDEEAEDEKHQDGPISLEPVVVGDQHENEARLEEEELPFHGMQDVDNLIRKYAAIIDRRARKLRGEPSPPPSVPSESRASTPPPDSERLEPQGEVVAGDADEESKPVETNDETPQLDHTQIDFDALPRHVPPSISTQSHYTLPPETISIPRPVQTAPATLSIPTASTSTDVAPAHAPIGIATPDRPIADISWLRLDSAEASEMSSAYELQRSEVTTRGTVMAPAEDIVEEGGEKVGGEAETVGVAPIQVEDAHVENRAESPPPEPDVEVGEGSTPDLPRQPYTPITSLAPPPKHAPFTRDYTQPLAPVTESPAPSPSFLSSSDSPDLLRHNMVITSLRAITENRKRRKTTQQTGGDVSGWDQGGKKPPAFAFADVYSHDEVLRMYQGESEGKSGKGGGGKTNKRGRLVHEDRRRAHESLLVPMEVAYAEAQAAQGPEGDNTKRKGKSQLQTRPESMTTWYPPTHHEKTDDADLTYDDMMRIAQPSLPHTQQRQPPSPPTQTSVPVETALTIQTSDAWVRPDALYTPSPFQGTERSGGATLMPDVAGDVAAWSRTPSPPPIVHIGDDNVEMRGADREGERAVFVPQTLWGDESVKEDEGVNKVFAEVEESGNVGVSGGEMQYLPVEENAVDLITIKESEEAEKPPVDVMSPGFEDTQQALHDIRDAFSDPTMEDEDMMDFPALEPQKLTTRRVSMPVQSRSPSARAAPSGTKRRRSRSWAAPAGTGVPIEISANLPPERPQTAVPATQPEIQEDPKAFYIRKRRSSAALIEMMTAGPPAPDETPPFEPARPASAAPETPTGGHLIEKHVGFALPDVTEAELEPVHLPPMPAPLQHGLPAALSSQENVAPDTELAAAGGPKTVSQALAAKGYAHGHGPNMYDSVHDPAKRAASMTATERARYPTFTEPPPPISAIEGVPPPTPMADPEDPQAEIHKLSSMIAVAAVPIPAYLRRRGVLYGRTGKYNEALNDLNKAVQYDPFNSDALWYRHQLHLMFGNIQIALNDLDAITETNRQHFGAVQAKARIYQELGMIKLAVVAYSQVIKLKPDDADGYYNRACLFEAENEAVYANEDFKMVRSLDPTNLHAIRNLAVYSFQRQLWDEAIGALTKLMRLSPEDGEIFALRGRAFAFMARWEEALADLTKAVQLMPDRADIFMYRASLVRERNPRRAIEDYSISILLDDSPSNIDAFYQRAGLYYKIQEYDLAIADYMTASTVSAVIDLDPAKSSAHLSLGILYMKFLQEYDKALDCFNKAISTDPVQIRAYLCRGDLHQVLHNWGADAPDAQPEKRSRRARGAANLAHVDRAIMDYGRAIHLCPSNYLLYLYRGRLLLRQGRMKEATYHFHAAFELNSEIAQTFVQRALVLSFQRKYHQIITEFNQRSRLEANDDPALFMLVAKARVKCGDNLGALKDLDRALELSKKDPQIYLQRGICYENLKDWANACREFTSCINLTPLFAKAYYHRGLCKLHEGNSKGIADMDKALKLDPTFFEAYLTRASYNHAKGNYVEGIDDCNEALKLEPTSIRAQLLRGACKCRLHQYGLALADFTKAITLDKASHFAFYNRAVTHQLLNDNESAIKDYSIVLLLHDDSNAYRNRGLLYWKQGDPENALLDLFAARKYFPEDARLHGLLALCLQKVGRIEESIAAFTSAITVNPYLTEAYLGRGNVYALRSQTKMARMDYGRVIHMYPRCTEAYVNMAYTMQMEGRYKKAWDLFSMALSIDPYCTSALEGRSVVHFSMRNLFGALVDICKAIEIMPRNSEYLTNRGVVYQALNDNISALQSYKLAIKYDPTYALAYLNAANLYFYQRRWEQALENYNKTLEMQPDDPSALLNRGITKAVLKDTQSALDDFDKAAELDPSSPEVHFNRAHILQSMGRYEEAEKEYTHVLELAPLDSMAYMKRGEARGHQSRMSEAMRDYAMAIAQEPE